MTCSVFDSVVGKVKIGTVTLQDDRRYRTGSAPRAKSEVRTVSDRTRISEVVVLGGDVVGDELGVMPDSPDERGTTA